MTRWVAVACGPGMPSVGPRGAALKAAARRFAVACGPALTAVPRGPVGVIWPGRRNGLLDRTKKPLGGM